MSIENALTIDSATVRATETGLCFDGDLSFEEWRDVGRKVGRVARTSLFLVGDWLVRAVFEASTPVGIRASFRRKSRPLISPNLDSARFAFDFFTRKPAPAPRSAKPLAPPGEARWNGGQRFEKMPGEQSARYIEAMQETGLELRTLMDAAYVARSVPYAERRPHLTFEHHKAVASLKSEDERGEWLEKADKQGLSTRRLRKSIQLGHVATKTEMQTPEVARGIDNHIPWVNGLLRWWKKFEESGWVENATREQLDAVLADLREVEALLEKLKDARDDKEAVIDVQ